MSKERSCSVLINDKYYNLNKIENLIDKDKNGIYISKDEARELLEALKLLNRRANSRAKLYFNDVSELEKCYNKLRNALGGNQ